MVESQYYPHLDSQSVVAGLNPQDISNKIQLSISCRNLADLDLFTKSDPQCVVYIKDSKNLHFTEIGKTEIINNNLNPDFTTSFTINYFFEREQILRFEVYDIDLNGGQEEIGVWETSISKIVTSNKQTQVGDLKLQQNPQGKSRGKIILRADSVADSNDLLTMTITARLQSIGRNWFCGLRDHPYLLISRARRLDDNQGEVEDFMRVYQSPLSIMGILNPQWSKIKLKMQQICNGDLNLPLMFSLYHYNEYSNHELYGEFVSSMALIMEQDKKQFELKDRRGAVQGVLIFNEIMIDQRPSFVDYLRSGWSINLAVAIDFTASNGQPYEQQSLHRQYLEPVQMNQYEQAIKSVGTILESYAYEQQFALFGFGGIPKYLGSKSVSHCFNLTGQQNPNVKGLEELFKVYKHALKGTEFSGPTYFTHILQAVLQYMKAQAGTQMYHLLLILTDGAIHDMQATKDLIVECSLYPLSIVIVGIGQADFQNMVELDGDEVILRNSKGKTAARDIVQFVEYNKFSQGDLSLLAEEVLQEVPEQIVGYMMMKGIQPRPLKQ